MAGTTRRLCAVLLILAVASCSAVFRNHGYVPTDADMAELQVGRTTRTEVAETVGRPQSTGILDSGGWYYVQSRFRHYGYREPVEVDREVVAISFTEAGVVRNVERFGLEKGRVVRLSRRVTESNVQGIGFLRQLFGNIGQFNAADFLDE